MQQVLGKIKSDCWRIKTGCPFYGQSMLIEKVKERMELVLLNHFQWIMAY